MNLDIISAAVTAPGATATAMAAVTGDSLSVRAARPGSEIILVQMWTKSQAVGVTQLTSPSLHDNVRGVRYRNLANQSDPKLAYGTPQPMVPQDPLALAQIGSAVGGDVEFAHLLLWYADLPGISAQLMTSAEVDGLTDELVTVEDTTTATVATTYSGSRALNAASDLLVANTRYAVLGAVIGAPCGALTIRGVDSGNLRCGIPGLSQDAKVTVNWFRDLSDWLGRPCIPVFNSANKTGIFVENVQDENLTAVPFSLMMAKLRDS